MRARSAAGVSPVRMPISGTWKVSPRRSAARAMPGERARAGCAPRPPPARAAARRRARGSASRFGGHGREHQPVDGGQERGQRLARAGGREDAASTRRPDLRPAQLLGARGRGERLREPLRHRGVEARSGDGGRASRHMCRGRQLRRCSAAQRPWPFERDPGDRQNGQSRVMGAAGGAGGRGRKRVDRATSRKIAKATIRKLITVLHEQPVARASAPPPPAPRPAWRSRGRTGR